MVFRRSNVFFLLAAMSALVVVAGCALAGSPASSQVANTEGASTVPPQETAAPMPSASGVPVTTLLPLPTLATPFVEPVTPFVDLTATPPPFPVKVIATSIYYPSVPDEYGYAFANPDDLRAARRIYEEYFDLLSFREAPPPPTDELTRQLTKYRELDPDPALNVPMNGRSCSISDVLSVIQRAGQASQYYRINAESLQWSDDHTFLRLNNSGVSLHSDWRTNAFVQLVERDTGRTVREKQMALLGTASLTIKDDGWIVVGESDGFYCDKVDFFDH